MEAGVESIRTHPSRPTSARRLSDPGEGVKGDDLSRKHWMTLNRLRSGVGRTNHLVTYTSAGRESQIDFLMCRRQQLNEVKNGKGYKRGSVAARCKVVVFDLVIKCSKRIRPEQLIPKMKWGRKKEENLKVQFREKVLSERRLLESV